MTAPEPAQPLTDREWERLGELVAAGHFDNEYRAVKGLYEAVMRERAEVSRLRAENTAQAEQLDRATKLANQLCNCDSYDCPPTEPATGAPLRHHCECAALLMETALDPAQGHQHEPCLTHDARALGLDQDGSRQ